jgi:hypothetical protein
MRRFRVISCLASSTQQMNSLRANGVMSFQAASAVELPISAWRKSAGSLCTTPPGTRLLFTGARVARYLSGLLHGRSICMTGTRSLTSTATAMIPTLLTCAEHRLHGISHAGELLGDRPQPVL